MKVQVSLPACHPPRVLPRHPTTPQERECLCKMEIACSLPVPPLQNQQSCLSACVHQALDGNGGGVVCSVCVCVQAACVRKVCVCACEGWSRVQKWRDTRGQV